MAEPQPAALPAPAGGPPAGDTQVKMSPIAGSEIPLDKVPAAVGRVTAADVQKDGSRQVQNALQQQVPGIILSDTAGSGFRTDVSYRGFDASPIGGRSQALAIYFNGIRINEIVRRHGELGCDPLDRHQRHRGGRRQSGVRLECHRRRDFDYPERRL